MSSELVKASLKNSILSYLNEHYIVATPHFHGMNLSAATVSISKFYWTFGLNGSGMTNNWKVLAKTANTPIGAFSVGQKAINDLNQRYSVSFSNNYRIVENKDLPEYEQQADKIVAEYKSYISGQPMESVGCERVYRSVCIEESIVESKKLLIEKLTGVVNGNGKITKFISAADNEALGVETAWGRAEVRNKYNRFNEARSAIELKQDSINKFIKDYVDEVFSSWTLENIQIYVTWDYFSFRIEHLTNDFLKNLLTVSQNNNLIEPDYRHNIDPKLRALIVNYLEIKEI